MSNTPRVNLDNIVQLEARRAAATQELPHLYGISPRNDGLWGVFCMACSKEAKSYTYPCKVSTLPGKRPPAVLTTLSVQKTVEDELHQVQGVIGYIAQLLGLWDDEEDLVNTRTIFNAIRDLKGLPPEPEQG